MLPYWYKQMIENTQGRSFQRGRPGENLVYKHEKFFIIGHFDPGYHPVINIRWIYSRACNEPSAKFSLGEVTSEKVPTRY